MHTPQRSTLHLASYQACLLLIDVPSPSRAGRTRPARSTCHHEPTTLSLHAISTVHAYPPRDNAYLDDDPRLLLPVQNGTHPVDRPALDPPPQAIPGTARRVDPPPTVTALIDKPAPPLTRQCVPTPVDDPSPANAGLDAPRPNGPTLPIASNPHTSTTQLDPRHIDTPTRRKSSRIVSTCRLLPHRIPSHLASSHRLAQPVRTPTRQRQATPHRLSMPYLANTGHFTTTTQAKPSRVDPGPADYPSPTGAAQAAASRLAPAYHDSPLHTPCDGPWHTHATPLDNASRTGACQCEPPRLRIAPQACAPQRSPTSQPRTDPANTLLSASTSPFVPDLPLTTRQSQA